MTSSDLAQPMHTAVPAAPPGKSWQLPRGSATTPGFLKILVWLAAAITAGVILLMVGYILVTGIPNLTLDLFAWTFTTDNQSMMPALVNTVVMTLLTLVMAVPVGVCAAIYMVEYAKRGNKLVKVGAPHRRDPLGHSLHRLRPLRHDVLQHSAGLGLFHAGRCGHAGHYDPASHPPHHEEALLSVPDSYREGSFGLGAGKLRTVFPGDFASRHARHSLGASSSPSAHCGARGAALIFTSGSGKDNLMLGKSGNFFADLFAPLFQSTRTLSVHMYNLMSEGLHMKEAQATAVVLLVLVIAINAGSARLAKKLSANGQQ